VAELFWTPEQETVPEVAGVTPHSRLVRFLGLSSMLHLAVVVASAWLVVPLSGAASDRLLVRTIDFVIPPGGGTERAGGSAADVPSSPSAARAQQAASSRAARGSVSQPTSASRPSAQRRSAAVKTAAVKTEARAPSTAPTTPAPEPKAHAREQAVDTPPPPAVDPREAMLAAATPKNVGPSSATVPAAGSVAPSARPADTSAIAGLARGAIGATVAAPVATVAVPPDLVTGSGGAGSGGGTGSGSGRGGGGSTGSGVGAGSGRGAGSGVDTQDPDFSDYFRVIERRVRAAWQFPQTLGGTTQTVKIGFALGPEGTLRQVRVVSSTSPTLDASALSAMKRAAPFPPLPVKFRTLAGQPLVMSFTVTIR
jgi:protein TonB